MAYVYTYNETENTYNFYDGEEFDQPIGILAKDVNWYFTWTDGKRSMFEFDNADDCLAYLIEIEELY